MKIFIFIIAACLSFITATVNAQYNANIKGVLSQVRTYTDGDFIYISLENQPTEHPVCNVGFFVISETVPFERRQMILSRLLAAYAMKENVNIGYDDKGDCAHGYIRVHEVG